MAKPLDCLRSMGFEEEIGSFSDDFTWNGYVGVGPGFDIGATEHDSVFDDGYDGGYIFIHDFSKWGWTLSDKECDQTYDDHEFNFIDWNVIGISSDTIFTYESGRAATNH